MRIAVEKGVGLLPVYYFGNAQLFDFGPKWLEKISRKFQMSLGIHYNRYLLPFPSKFYLTQGKLPMMCVVGKSIETKQTLPTDPGYESYVSEIHEKFLAELNDMYISDDF